jgi:hypothetical protein
MNNLTTCGSPIFLFGGPNLLQPRGKSSSNNLQQLVRWRRVTSLCDARQPVDDNVLRIWEAHDNDVNAIQQAITASIEPRRTNPVSRPSAPRMENIELSPHQPRRATFLTARGATRQIVRSAANS